jgi:hypothetical protein
MTMEKEITIRKIIHINTMIINLIHTIIINLNNIVINLIPIDIKVMIIDIEEIVNIIPKIIVDIGGHGVNGMNIIEIIDTNIVVEDTIETHMEVYILPLRQLKEVSHFQLEDKKNIRYKR